MGARISNLTSDDQKKLLTTLEEEAKKEVDASDISNDDMKQEVIRLRAIFHGTLTKLNAAAKKKKYRASKHTLDDGTVIEVFEDGRRKQSNADGSSLENHVDGTVIQISTDGTRIEKRPDGSQLQTKADGSSIERTAEQVIIQINAKGVRLEVRPDGTKIQSSPDGVKIQMFPDGTKIDTDAKGYKVIKYADGRKVQRNPNGTVIETFPDGKKVQTMADGSKIELYPDGRRIDISVAGDVLERLPDGTEIRQKLRTSNCVKCWKCTTVVSVPIGKFTFCCPMCRTILLANKCKVIGSEKTAAETGGSTEEERESEVKAVFERFDRDSSGSIDKKELAEMLTELNFGATAFEEIYKEADTNSDGVLQYPEFVFYFNQLQKKMLETASAPVVEMTRDLLEKQKAELNKERVRLEAQNKELSARLNKDADAKAAFATAEEQLKQINSEFKQKEKQISDTLAEQKRRQKSFLRDRLKNRRKKK